MATRPEKIPLWATLDRAFEITFDNLWPALRIAGAWAAIAFVLVGAIHWLLAGWRTDGVLDPPALLSLLVSLAAGCSIAVGWHRLFLLQETAPAFPYLRLDAVVLRYAAAVAAMLVLPVVPLHILEWLGAPTDVNLAHGGAPIWWGLAVLAYIVATIVAIVAAAVGLAGLAVDAPPGPTEVYRRTSSNSFRLLFGAAFACLPLGVALAVVEMWGPGRSTPLRLALTEALSEAASLTFSAVLVAFLSLCYRQLFGERD